MFTKQKPVARALKPKRNTDMSWQSGPTKEAKIEVLHEYKKRSRVTKKTY